MGIWSRIFRGREKSTSTSSNPASWFLDWFSGGEKTTAGVAVTTESAMRLSAVWACVRVRSEDVAKLPCHLYKRLPGGGKERAVDHPLYSLIHDRPNPLQTAFEFKQLMQATVDLKGNAYALKEMDGRGRTIALWPLARSTVEVLATVDGRELFYRVANPKGATETFPAEAMLHLRGMTLDGLVGLSPISYHRETIGLAIAQKTYGAAFYGNSAKPDGVLKVKRVLSPDAAKALRADWESKYRGVDNARRLAILDGEMDFQQTTMDHTDAQYIESRNFENREIWRIYRVPAHKVGDLERSTNNNIEQQALEYVQECLLTETTRWQETLARDLLNDADRETYFFEFLLDALLRGDFKTRTEGYASGLLNGWLSVNDVREKENMNPVKGGDAYFRPLNVTPLDAPAPPPPPTPPVADPGAN